MILEPMIRYQYIVRRIAATAIRPEWPALQRKFRESCTLPLQRTTGQPCAASAVESELSESALAAFGGLADGVGEGAGDGFENFRAGGADIVGRRMEESMQAGDAKEIRIAGRVHVAQLADGLLLGDQTRRLDACEGFADQGLGGRTEHDRAKRIVDPVLPRKALRSGGPGVAGVGGAEMHPGQRVPRRRRAMLEKQLHAAMTDLMTGRRDKDELARQLLRGDG